MKIALVYDRVNKWGGAERILIALSELYPNADLYTSVYDSSNASWAKVFNVYPSFLNRLKFARKRHELFAPLMPMAFDHMDFSDYDLVISITSESAKGIITKPATLHICYLLTPTRYLWSGYDDYFNSSLKRIIFYPVVAYLRKWDLFASSRPDYYISISDEVRKRAKKYYQKDSIVVYPPNNLDINTQSSDAIRGNYFLVVSRLVPYKRVDLVIKAANKLSINLKIVGVGSELRSLKKIAGDTVEFLGSLTDSELVKYYKGCKGLIFAGHEDFGLTIVEAQMFGKPVIAYRSGGAIETVKDKKTGLFFDKQTVTSLTEALVKFKSIKFDRKVCIDNATNFSKNNFKLNFSREVERIILKHNI